MYIVFLQSDAFTAWIITLHAGAPSQVTWVPDWPRVSDYAGLWDVYFIYGANDTDVFIVSPKLTDIDARLSKA